VREGSYSIFGEDTTIEVVTEFGTRTARVEESSPEALARTIARGLAEAAANGKNSDGE
jgi:hypothetical protein